MRFPSGGRLRDGAARAISRAASASLSFGASRATRPSVNASSAPGDLPGRPHGAAKSRVDAEHALRETEAELAVVRADTVVAGERELEAAAEREAVDRGDGRHRQRFEPVEDFLPGANELIGLLEV